MSLQLLPLLQILSDGKFHSGDDLGQLFDVSRTTIWKLSKKIAGLGLDIHSVRGKGYRLRRPLELLDREKLLAELTSGQRAKVAELELLTVVDSTNSHAMRRIQKGSFELAGAKVLVFLAEQQTAGKGRRGKEWVSPFGSNMYLSVVREFESGAVGLEGLSLVVGLVLVRALAKLGVAGLGVKWPNDLLWNEKKLAGILLEMTGDLTGACQVVVGIGLNIQSDEAGMESVDQPWVDLSRVQHFQSGRNQLVGQVISELLTALDEFEDKGFAGFKQEWEKTDVLAGVQVELKRSASQEQGVIGEAVGVDGSGALLIKTAEGLELFHGGEVSVRRMQVENDS